jgi:hypothetical protein
MQSPNPYCEPDIAAFCCECSDIGSPLTRAQVLLLDIDIFRNTGYKMAMIDHKQKRNIDYTKILSHKWYQSFMYRFSDILKRGRCKHKDVKRLTWCTHENISNMYNSNYESIIEARVAIKHEDQEGNITKDETKQWGCK